MLTPTHIRTLGLCAAIACFGGCGRPAKPAKNGTGEYALLIDKSLTPPKFHQPLDKWIATHPKKIKRRERSRYQCVLCHNPQTTCNQCHRYMGLYRGIYKTTTPVTVTAAPAPGGQP